MGSISTVAALCAQSSAARVRDDQRLLRLVAPCRLSSAHVLLRTASFSPILTRKVGQLAANSSNSTHAHPVVKAEHSSQHLPDYVPDAKFYKVEAILRPWRVPHVSSGLIKMGIRGVTVSDVRGFGAQGGLAERQAGSEFSEDNFVTKTKMEIVVCKDQVEAVVEKIIEEARTGEIGDGKIFVIPVSDVIRVRTGERGEKAEKMTGGRLDMITAVDTNNRG